MPRDDVARLVDMLNAARHAREFVAKLTFEQFQVSHLYQHAVVRALETVGEAARGISPPFREAHPELPWAAMVAMRNYLLHEYFRVDTETVWRTVQEDIPQVICALDNLISDED